jgi:hypothetical protein
MLENKGVKENYSLEIDGMALYVKILSKNKTGFQLNNTPVFR